MDLKTRLRIDDEDPHMPGTQVEQGKLAGAWAPGNLDIVGVLLGATACPNQSKSDGSTALHVACHTGQLELARLLLDAGAEKNQGTK